MGVVMENPGNIFLGDNVWIDNYVILLTGKPKKNGIKIYRKSNSEYSNGEGELHIGNNVHIAPFCVLQAHGGIAIGNNCGVAAGSKIYSYSNHYKNLNDPTDKGEYYFTPLANLENQAYILSPIVIKDNCAIGLNSVVLPGTIIPKGTWIGVNTTIQGTAIKENSIYAGDPAKFIKEK